MKYGLLKYRWHGRKQKPFALLFSYFNFLILPAALLAGCSSEADEPMLPKAPDAEAYTTFSAVTPAATRTMMVTDAAGTRFDWTPGDKIFIEKDKTLTNPSESHPRSTGGDILTAQTDADFFFAGHYTNQNYLVYYTGHDMNNDPSGNGQVWNRVTIADKQVQKLPNNSEHLAYSGDCGTALAVRTPYGNSTGYRYEFTLDHKAAYLVFKPKTAADPLTDYCYLYRITVEDVDSGALCGTYEFGDTGLNTDPTAVTNKKSKINLVLSERLDDSGNIVVSKPTGDFQLKATADNAAYLVMQPGSHKLKITYQLAYFRLQNATTNPSNGYWLYDFTDNLVTIEKTIDTKDYQAGYYYTVAHTLDLQPYGPQFIYDYDVYYQWDAETPYFEGVSASELPSKNNAVYRFPYASTSTWNSSSTTASNSAAFSPNANQATYYMKYGNVHHDTETRWLLRGFDGGYTLCTGGVWILKKQYILETLSADDQAHFNNGDYDCIQHRDLRSYNVSSGSNDYKMYYRDFPADCLQAPADSEKYKYFFLPRLGHMQTENFSNSQIKGMMKNVGAEGHFVLSNRPSEKIDNTWRPYTFYIMDKADGQYINLAVSMKDCNYGSPSYKRTDGEYWFQ